jgi:tetrahydromethanopterin S-methyltransferase subunit G
LARDLSSVAAEDGQVPEAARDKDVARNLNEKVDLMDERMQKAQRIVLRLGKKGIEGEWTWVSLGIGAGLVLHKAV